MGAWPIRDRSQMILDTYTKSYFRRDCGPNGKEFVVSHLTSGRNTWGPWYCDYCHCSWSGIVNSEGKLEAEKSTIRTARKIVALLRLDYQPERPIHIMATTYEFNGKREDVDAHRCFFEEHTCPINILTRAEKIYVGKDDDEHGLFRLVGLCQETWPQDYQEQERYCERFSDEIEE